MIKRMVAIAAAYVFVSVAWMVLGGSVVVRTESGDQRLKSEVSALWGAPQAQVSTTRGSGFVVQ